MLAGPLMEKFEKIVAKYPIKRSALIPILLITQEEIGYLTPEALRTISVFLAVPEVEVYEAVTFYSMLRTNPVGKYHIQVCTNISCMLLGGEEVFEHISKRLGVKEGGTTPDKLFSLTEVECLGACCNAPAMQINYQYHEDLTLQKVDRILDKLTEQG